MYLSLTRLQLKNKFSKMSSLEIIDYLVGEGLALALIPPTESGIYRREKGEDLALYDGSKWTPVPIHAESEHFKISWVLYGDTEDWWVRVLDGDNYPVYNGMRICMNQKGERVA